MANGGWTPELTNDTEIEALPSLGGCAKKKKKKSSPDVYTVGVKGGEIPVVPLPTITACLLLYLLRRCLLLY